MERPAGTVRGVREVVVQRGRVTSGWFRARPGQPGFEGGLVDRPLVVFPRTAVAIRHPHRDEVVADPTVAMLYNRGDEYHRRRIDPAGDRCEWLSIPDDWWAQLCATVDPAHDASHASTDGGRVFRRDHGPTPADAYLRQRRLTTALASGRVSALAAEETALAVIRDVLVAAGGGPVLAGSPRAGTRARHRALVNDTRELLAATYARDASLDDVAGEVGSSPYHLSRLFRAHTGSTIHRHRTQLRLRASLDRLDERDLSALALDLGFASHSHFTATFRRAFGCPPSEVRTILTA